MSRIADLGEARVEAVEARSWVCSSCDKMIEEGQPEPYCRSCAMYWQDVATGLFDDPWPWQHEEVRFDDCRDCGGEGRVLGRGLVYEPGCGHAHVGEVDHGRCDTCGGQGVVEIDVEPVTLEDLETSP